MKGGILAIESRFPENGGSCGGIGKLRHLVVNGRKWAYRCFQAFER